MSVASVNTGEGCGVDFGKMHGAHRPHRIPPLVCAAGLLVAACAGKSQGAQKIASPDPHAAPSTTADSAATPSPDADGPQDIASICAQAEPIAAQRFRGAAAGHAMFAMVKKYSMADLEALAKAKQYRELLEHIEDIGPANRGARWSELLATAATKVVESTNSAKGFAIYESFMIAESSVERHPALAKNNAFMAARAKAGKSAFEQCFANSYRGDECFNAATSFVAVEGTSSKVKLDVAKIARRNLNHYASVPLFAAALAAGDLGSACEDEDFELAITAGLGLPPDYDSAKTSRQVAAGACFDALRPAIEASLQESPTGYVRDNACAVLSAKGAVQ